MTAWPWVLRAKLERAVEVEGQWRGAEGAVGAAQTRGGNGRKLGAAGRFIVIGDY